MIRECMFCPKPHYNKSDNLYKLCESNVWIHVQVHQQEDRSFYLPPLRCFRLVV